MDIENQNPELPPVYLDEELGQAMDVAFDLINSRVDNHDTPEQLRMRIAAHNLRALAQVVLIADSSDGEIGVNLKQMTLGLLGTADWMLKYLPELED